MTLRLAFLALVTFSTTTCFAQKEVKTYYDSLRKQLKEDYFVSSNDNETPDGKYKRYYPSGKLEIEGEYHDGKRNGIFTMYHENGQLARKVNYVDGQRQGIIEAYDEDSKPVQKEANQNNVKPIKTYYDPLRKQIQEDYFVVASDNETIEGKYKRFYPNGKVEMEGDYHDGNRSGTFLEYHENGL